MQQKIQFIVTVIHRPELLILDEPFSGFDPVNASRLKEEIRELREKGATVILSTHNMNSAEELCDEISLIDRSKVVLSGRVDAIKEQYKKNIFSVRTESPLPEPDAAAGYRILESRNTGRYTESIIRKTDGADTPALISQLARTARLSAFEEILPGMDEIFIDVVKPH